MKEDEEGSKVLATLTSSLMAIGRTQRSADYVPPTLQQPKGKTPGKKWNKAKVAKRQARKNR